MRKIDRPLRTVIGHGVAVLVFTTLFGCSVNKVAVNKLGDVLAESETTFAADDDPDLVGGALPFTLKLIESLLAESPEHPGLLLAAVRGFTQYSYGWVHQRGDELVNDDFEQARSLHRRAKLLYLRASGYGIRALEVSEPGISERLRFEPATTLARVGRDDVPALYWTAAALGLAVSVSKDDPEIIAELPIVEAMIDRAFELEETFEHGAIHGFLISFEPNRASANPAESEARVRHHFDRAVALSGGELASPYVSLAETISIPSQNRDEFETLIESALAIDPDVRVEWRLQNLLSQRRARWLLANVEDLFWEDDTDEGDENGR